jgi:hypothetical protein
VESKSTQITLHEPVYNERGIIAENYHDLQGLGVLESARHAYPLRKSSDESTLRAVFQAAETALLNLADVVARSIADLEQERFSTATVKMFWARGFHRLLTRLSLVPLKLGVHLPAPEESGTLRIHDSVAFQEYIANLHRFDRKVIHLIEAGALAPEAAIGEQSLDSWQYNFFHLIKICNHESTIWEHNLAEVRVPAPVPSYQEFVVSSIVRDAVYDRVLKGDTYFTQFRGLHQIPETLGEEVNDRLEETIRHLHADRLPEAIDQLICIDILTEVIAAAVPPMADNLATSDYHVIRENLGLTSGSHSVCLRFHMFTHLYDDLYDELSKCALRLCPSANEPKEAFRNAAQNKADDSRAWLVNLAGGYCLKFRAFISEWRDEHIHMPRNNLGGELTKSLTGSPDAVRAVKSMRDAAHSRDPFSVLAQARNLVDQKVDKTLAQYFDSHESLDWQLLAITGRTTQERFVQVQERLGFFANRCPFTPPPRRKA